MESKKKNWEMINCKKTEGIFAPRQIVREAWWQEWT